MTMAAIGPGICMATFGRRRRSLVLPARRSRGSRTHRRGNTTRQAFPLILCCLAAVLLTFWTLGLARVASLFSRAAWPWLHSYAGYEAPPLPFAAPPPTQPSPCRDFAAERMPQPHRPGTRRTMQLRGSARSLFSAGFLYFCRVCFLLLLPVVGYVGCLWVCMWGVSSRPPRENPLQDGRSVTQQLRPGEASYHPALQAD